MGVIHGFLAAKGTRECSSLSWGCPSVSLHSWVWDKQGTVLRFVAVKWTERGY